MRARWTVALGTALLTASPGAAQSDGPEDQLKTIGLAPVPADLAPDAQVAVAGINAFSIDLYRQTVVRDQNHFLSPASISTAMSLAYRAAAGTTADEMRRTLHYSSPPADYLKAPSGVLASMNFSQPGRELATANSIWVDKSVTLRPDYLADTKVLAGSAIEQVDFQRDHNAARLAINEWVEVRTGDRIKDLLAPALVTADTRSVLVNTIYLKAAWASPFPKSTTKSEPFRTPDRQTVDVPMMHQSAAFQVLDRDGMKAILLPYQGGELEMAVFLPDENLGLPRFEAELTADRMSGWLNRLTAAPSRYTDLTLPRMNLSWGGDMVPTLRAMGMTTAFSYDADFSAITVPNDERTLAIDAVVHKAFLDLDEEGSEAAAATAAVTIMVTSKRRPPPKPFVFRADRPFFFVVRDRRTGLISFMGRFIKAERAR